MSTSFRSCLPTICVALAAAFGGSLPTLAAPPTGDDPSPVIVTVTDIHLCCGACVKALKKAAEVDGVQAEVNQDERAAVLTGATYADVQKSLEEIAAAGLSGKIEDDTQAGRVHFPAIKTPGNKVKELKVRHIHNCCRGCATAIAAAVESVDGVTSHTVKPKATSFEVRGEFEPGEVTAALLEAGFYPQLH